MKPYAQFLAEKAALAGLHGFEVKPQQVNALLKPHQRDIVCWAVAKGRAAIFAAFGLGKTFMQLEVARIITEREGGNFLIVAPLGVRQEFRRDAEKLGIATRFIRRTEELQEICAFVGGSTDAHPEICDGCGKDFSEHHSPIYLTNYESIREGKLDPHQFTGVSLDEASVLRGFGGTKTFREFMRLFENRGRFKFVATATPSPNEFIELLAYAAFLDVMDVGQAKTRFFKRDSTQADKLTLHPHKEREFWLWVASWAIFLQKPSDLGYSDEGYALPELQVNWHEVASDHRDAGHETSGQGRLTRNAAIGVTHAAREKRDSLGARIQKMLELRQEDPEQHRLIWHDLEAERFAIEEAINGRTEQVRGAAESQLEQSRVSVEGDGSAGEPAAGLHPHSRPGGANGGAAGARRIHPGLRVRADQEKAERFSLTKPFASVYGNQKLEEREQHICDFSDGLIQELAAKPVLAGSGCNFQRHCAWAIFLGIGFKFNDFIQALHRIQRFLQTRPVRIDLIYTEAEREIRRVLEEKWARHQELTAQMTGIIRQYGLAASAAQHELKRQIGVERAEITGENYRCINNDAVLEAERMEADSCHLILTSIPFSTQYEYTPSYNDFGHSDSNQHFFEQMDYLTPNLLRVLQPGRVAAIHVKDRIVPGGLTGLGFQTVYPFSDETIRHFVKHGFAFLGRKTIVTDVVRENNQTYRLGWTEQCKDGSRMGFGMPEYLLLFRKPPTDRSNGYADAPVIKDKGEYSRSRWQIDAHGFARSSGNRLLSSEDLASAPHERIFKLFRRHSLANVYDYENHVGLSESLERCPDCGHIHTGESFADGGTRSAPKQKTCGVPVLAEGCAIKSNPCQCPKSGGRLPVTFMLLQPQSWHPEVWSDITRMLSLNSAQSAAGREMHLCPLQFDIADRVIAQFSMPGEVVLDPFAGLMTVPYRAVRLKRKGIGIELSTRYFLDGVAYCRAAEQQASVPTLFDMDSEAAPEEAEVLA